MKRGHLLRTRARSRAKLFVTFLAFASIAAGSTLACYEGGNGTGWPLTKDATIPIHDGTDIDRSGDEEDGGPTNTPRDGGPTGTPDCSAPTSAFPSPDKGPYCTFMMPSNTNCAIGQHCCIYPQSAQKSSTCNNAGVACDNDVATDFACDEPGDCPTAAPRCCYRGEVAPEAQCPALPRLFNVTQTYCTANAACDEGGLAVCAQQSDCQTGTCRFGRGKGKVLGACVP